MDNQRVAIARYLSLRARQNLPYERAIEVARAVSEGVESVPTIGQSAYADPFVTSALLSIHLPLYPNLHLQLHSDFAPELVRPLDE
jgi:hypothetical protein